MTNHRALRLACLFAAAVGAPAVSWTQRLPDPPRQPLPEWARRDGIIMAGNWESLNYRLRAGAFTTPGGDFAEIEEGLARFKRGFTEETARKLKEMGFNFVMVPLYKGFGLEAEREQMELTKEFTAICHRLGLRVGVYTFSNTIGWENVLAENPEAEEWLLRDAHGEPLYYNWSNSRMYYRFSVNRDHPGVRAMMRELVRYAVTEAKVDLLHFDNYHDGPLYEDYSVRRFREYLAKKYTPGQRRLRFGFSSVEGIKPPLEPGEGATWIRDPLIRDFIDYRVEMQADTYRELSEYARSLNPEVIVECNAGGYHRRRDLSAMDLARMLPWGNAFWDEGRPSHLENGVVHSRFRSHMFGRQFDNMVFQYTSDPVGMAESMTLNYMSLGCSVKFENGVFTPNVSNRPDRTTVDPTILAYVAFFRKHTALYRDAEPVTDVAILNTFGDDAFGPFEDRGRATALEQSFYQGKVPFTIVPAQYAGDLCRFKAIVLPSLRYLEPAAVAALREYVACGGALMLVGDAGKFADLLPSPPSGEELRARSGAGRLVFVPKLLPAAQHRPGLPGNHDALIDAARWAAGGTLAVEVAAPLTTTMAFYTQPSGRRLLHLVNYDEELPAADIGITLASRASRATLYSPDGDTEVALPIETTGAGCTMRVPTLKTYALIAIE